MTRETKVGLVIGLGVILLVGIIVSEYFVRDESLQEQPLAAGMSDFNNNSNQSAFHTRTADGGVVDPYARQPMRPAPATPIGPVTQPGTQQTDTQTTQQPGIRRGPNRLGADVALSPMPIGQFSGQGHSTPPAQPSPGPGVRPGAGAGHHQAQSPVATQRQHITGRATTWDPTGTESDATPMLDTTRPIDALPTDPPAPTMIEHVVAESETLTQIARQYYHGDGNMWRSIRDANRDLVDADGRVRAGTILRIPKRSGDHDARMTGNTPDRPEVGPALSDSDRVTALRNRRGRVVVVKDGDTLSAIASEYLGSANDWQMLIDANLDVLTDASELRGGMELRIPAQVEADVAEQANGALSAPAEQPTRRAGPDRDRTTTPPPPASRTYTVVDGDSLYRIAEKTLGSGSRYHEIFEANKDQLDDENDIREGDILRIPASD